MRHSLGVIALRARTTLLRLLLATAATACGRGEPDGVRSVRLAALSWTGEHIVYSRLDVTDSASVFRTDCDRAGLYWITLRAESGVVDTSAAICHLLQSSPMMSVDRSGTSLVLADQNDAGTIKSYDLTTRQEAVLVERCLPVLGTPSFSNDGDAIAYSRHCGDAEEAASLVLADRDGSHERPAGRQAAPSYESMPSWSPDGRYLAFQSGSVLWQSTIMIVDTLRQSRYPLTGGYAPSWDPTGTWIAFLRMESAETAPTLRVIRTDGTGERVLRIAASPPASGADGRWVTGRLVWSPTGEWIAAARGTAILAVSVRADSVVELMINR